MDQDTIFLILIILSYVLPLSVIYLFHKEYSTLLKKEFLVRDGFLF